MAVKVKLGLACEIAGLEKQQFNQAVHEGHYSCAPAVAQGGTRLFEINDLIALFIFARLRQNGMSVAGSGEWACKIRALIDDPKFDEAAATANVVITPKRIHFQIAGKFSPAAKSFKGEPAIFSASWAISGIRQLILDEIDAYKKRPPDSEVIG